MKLKTEEKNTPIEEVDSQSVSSNSIYKKIIKDRIQFIEESLRVIKESFNHLYSEDEDND